MKYFEVTYLDEAIDFIRSLDKMEAKKILYNIGKAQQTKDPTIFKKLKGSDVWEFRAKVRGNQYRLFAFWDKENGAYVICTHGILKRTQKTPVKEINKAERIRKSYSNRRDKR